MLGPEVYQRYADIRRELKILEELEDSLRGTILRDLKERGVEKEHRDQSTFTVVRKSTWEYTEKVKALEDKVKIAKVREQERGDAKETIADSLRYTVRDT